MARLAALLVYALSASVALAATLDASLIQTSGNPSVGRGKFYGYRTKTEGPGDDTLVRAQALAEAEHVPLVVVWSEEQCEHCNAFISELNERVAEVSAFLSTNRAVFAFFKADTPDDDEPMPSYSPQVVYRAYRFATETCGGEPAFPVFGFYYKKADGAVVPGGSPYGYGSRDWVGFKKLYLGWLSANGIHPEYLGGKFAASGTEFDRYEAEATTEWVDVELVREAEDAVGGVTNLLVTTWPDGNAITNEMEWVAQETAKTVRVDIPAGKFALGGSALLTLCDSDGVRHSTNAIHFVEKENGNGNPLWIGERDANTLKFGEWTMDLDVATNKVAAFDGAAYTLVSVQGSLWCPDCGNADRNFMDVEDGEGPFDRSKVADVWRRS